MLERQFFIKGIIKGGLGLCQSRSSLHRHIAEGLFPPADGHQNRKPFWRESTLEAHQRALCEEESTA